MLTTRSACGRSHGFWRRGGSSRARRSRSSTTYDLFRERGLATRLRLVRHARADYAWLTGTPEMVDAPLSPQGEAQLPALVERLRGDPPGYVYVSPTLRTMATAHAIASGLGVRPVAWALLCEEAFLHGAPGYGRSELAARFPLIVLADEIREEGWTGGRTREDDMPWSRRARQVLKDLLVRHPREGNDDVLLVTHLAFGVDLVQEGAAHF